MKKILPSTLFFSLIMLLLTTGCRTGVFVQQCQGAACAGVTVGFDQELILTIRDTRSGPGRLYA
jgi:hypothetical protein